jgi:hypothetical protein
MVKKKAYILLNDIIKNYINYLPQALQLAFGFVALEIIGMLNKTLAGIGGSEGAS